MALLSLRHSIRSRKDQYDSIGNSESKGTFAPQEALIRLTESAAAMPGNMAMNSAHIAPKERVITDDERHVITKVGSTLRVEELKVGDNGKEEGADDGNYMV